MSKKDDRIAQLEQENASLREQMGRERARYARMLTRAEAGIKRPAPASEPAQEEDQ